MAPKTACPSMDQLAALLSGNLEESAVAELASHVEECDTCQQAAATLSPHDTMLENARGEFSQTDRLTEAVPSSMVAKLKGLARPTQNPDGATVDMGSFSPEPPSDDLTFLEAAQAPGELGRLGRYRVLRILGKGGMGMVFLGHDPDLDREVALKVMLPKFAANETAKKRFLREARTAAKVKNDHIVSIFDVDGTGVVPFLAMELLDGMPLDQYLAAKPKLTLSQILRIGRETAKGLAAAHEKGLVHRDIKPGNLWLDSHNQDRVKILDFGLARAEKDDIQMTGSGVIVGTPAFMAPEQARGHADIDARADLFSLGCVLYRLCVGDLPFKSETTMGVLLAIATEEPIVPAKMDAALPIELWELIMQLLRKDPAQRPQSAKAVLQRFAEIERKYAHLIKDDVDAEPQKIAVVTLTAPPTESLAPTQPAPRRRRGFGVAIGAALIATVVGLAGVILLPGNNGTIEIRTDEKDIEVVVTDAGGKAKILDPKTKQVWVVDPGKYTLSLQGDNAAGLEFELPEDRPFDLKRGDRKVVTIRRIPVVAKVDPKNDPPPAAPDRTSLGFSANGETVEFPSLVLPDGASTIEGWVTPLATKPSKDNVVASVFGTFPRLTLDINTAGKWSFNWVFDSGVGSGINGALAKREATHVALVRDVGEHRLYVNGTLTAKAQVPNDALTKKHEPFRLGGKDQLGHFAGWIRDVRVSKVARYAKDFSPSNLHAVDADTLALWRCDEGSGEKVGDLSGNGHHGKIIGAKWSAAPRTTPPVPVGEFALRITRDAGTTGVELPDIDLDPSGPATVEAYCEHGDYQGTLLAIRQLLITSSPARWAIQAGPGKTGDQGAKFARGVPVHLAAVWTGNAARFFVNGSMVDEMKDLANTAKGKKTYLHFGKGWTGLVREVRISKVARYEKDYTPKVRFEPDADTVALYHCDEGQGDKLTDSSGNGYHGKIISAKWVKADGKPIPTMPKTGDYAIQFTGKDLAKIPAKFDSSRPFTLEGYFTLQKAPTITSPYVVHLIGDMKFPFLNVTQKDWVGTVVYAAADSVKKGGLNSIYAKHVLHRRTHVALVGASNKLDLYIDGKRYEGKSLFNPEDRKFGKFEGAELLLGSGFEGLMDEIRISQVARYAGDFVPESRFQPDPQTVALYHCDEGAGEVLKDSSGNENHGKLVGAKRVDSNGNAVVTSEVALDFSRNRDVDTPGVTLPLGLIENKKDFTIEIDLTPRSVSTANDRRSVWNLDGMCDIYQCGEFWLFQNLSRHGVKAGERVRLTAVCTPTENRFFINGKRSGTGTHPAVIGSRPKSHTLAGLSPFPHMPVAKTSSHFDGTIHQVRISKTARYAEEYEPQPILKSDSDTVALYRCDEGAGDKLIDSSGNGNHGTIVGMKPMSPPQCLIVWQGGGQSQIDTFDPKPLAKDLSVFKAIDTSVPGMQFAETLPKLASQAHHLAVIRTMNYRDKPDHARGSIWMHTGRNPDEANLPTLGSVLGRELQRPGLPRFVGIGLYMPRKGVEKDEESTNARVFSPGLLGREFAFLPLKPQIKPKVEDFEEAAKDEAEILHKNILPAFNYLGGAKKDWQRYGSPTNQSFLLAKNLLELGVPVVEVATGGWDSHANILEGIPIHCEKFDQPLATLLADLEASGRLRNTLVVVMSEFGRTPRMNANGGREHWADGFSVLLGGGLVNGGQVIGKTSPDGSKIVERPVSVEELHATIYTALGIDPSKQLGGPNNLTLPLVEKGTKPIAELIPPARLKEPAIGVKWVKTKSSAVEELMPQGDYALRIDTVPGKEGVKVDRFLTDEFQDLTFEAYCTPGDGKHEIVLATDHFGISIITPPNGVPLWSVNGGASNEIFAPVVANKRVHVAAVRTETGANLFVDGKLVTHFKKVSKLAKSEPLHIGWPYKGMIDEIRISKVARYQKNFTPQSRFETDADTIALYHCDEGGGDKLIDSSGNGYHAAVVGAKWVKIGESPSFDADRKAAEWALSSVSQLTIWEDGKEKEIRSINDLPAGPFELTMAYLFSKEVTDETLAIFKDCANLKHLRIERHVVTDAGLAHFRDCANLDTLRLHLPKMSDKGLALFRDHAKLKYLYLVGAPITDDGILPFQTCNNLVVLHLSKTKVTPEAIAKLRQALPKCTIEYDGNTGQPADDRKAAEYAISLGGNVRVNGEVRNLHTQSELPPGRLELTQLDLTGTKVTDAGLAQFADCKKLLALILIGTKTTDAGLDHFRNCKGLTYLDLAGTNIGDAGLAKLKDCMGLRALNFNQTKVTDAGLAHFANCDGLEDLLLLNTKTSDAGLAHFRRCRNIRILDLRGTAVTDQGLSYFKDRNEMVGLILSGTAITDAGLAYFKDCTKIAELGLLSTQIGDAGLAHLGNNKNLKALDLGYTRTTDAGLAHFKDCSELRLLSVVNTQVGDKGLSDFGKCKDLLNLNVSLTQTTDAGLAVFKNCKNLIDLNVGETKVTDAGLAPFKDCKNLEHIWLHKTQLGDASLAHFKECKKLVSVHLSETQVTDEVLIQLKDCKGLVFLNVNKTKVTAKGIESFRLALPRCRIEYDGQVIEPRNIPKSAELKAPKLPKGEEFPEDDAFEGKRFVDDRLVKEETLFRLNNSLVTRKGKHGVLSTEVANEKDTYMYDVLAVDRKDSANMAFATRVRIDKGMLLFAFRTKIGKKDGHWLVLRILSSGRVVLLRNELKYVDGKRADNVTVISDSGEDEPEFAAGKWLNVAARTRGDRYDVWINGKRVASGNESAVLGEPNVGEYAVQVLSWPQAAGPHTFAIKYLSVWQLPPGDTPPANDAKK